MCLGVCFHINCRTFNFELASSSFISRNIALLVECQCPNISGIVVQLVVFRITKLEGNSKIFDGKGWENMDFLWDGVGFWASLWDSISNEFKDILFLFLNVAALS